MTRPIPSETSQFSEFAGWPIIFLYLLCGIAGAFQIGKMPPLLPVLQEEIGINTFQLGLIVAMFNIVGASVGALMGMLVDFTAPRKMIITGLFLIGGASILGGLTSSAIEMIMTRAIEGVGFMLLLAALPTEMNRLSDIRHKPLVMGVWGTFMPLGMASAMFVAPWLLEHYGWHNLFFFSGFVCWVMVLILVLSKMLFPGYFTLNLLYPEKSNNNKKLFSRDNIIAVITGKKIIATGFVFACYSYMYNAVLTFIPLMLVGLHELDLFRASMIAALYALCNALGNLIGGFLVKTGFAPHKLMAFTGVSLGILSCLIYLPEVLWVKLIALFLYPVIGGFIPACIFFLIPKFSPTSALIGISNGMVMQLQNIGMIAGVIIVSGVFQRVQDWRIATIIVCMGAILCVWLSLKLKDDDEV